MKNLIRKLLTMVVVLALLTTGNITILPASQAQTETLASDETIYQKAIDSDTLQKINRKIPEIRNSIKEDSTKANVVASTTATSISLDVNAAIASSANLIVNGDFEADPSIYGTWDAFFTSPGGIAQFIWDSQTFHGSSGHSLQITGTNIEGYMANEIPITAGRTYSYSLWAKALNIAQTSGQGGSVIYFSQYDANGNYISNSSSLFSSTAPTFDWDNLAINITAAPNASSIFMMIGLEGSGSVWYDDVSLTEVAPADIPATGISLENPQSSMSVGQTQQMKANIAPSNATNKNVLWSITNSSAPNVAQISSTGLLTASNPGTVTIRAACASNMSLYAECNVTITLSNNIMLPSNAVISDTELDPTAPVLYAVDTANRKLYAINYETKTTTEVAFALQPERVVYKNGKLYVTLLKMQHDDYVDDPYQTGAFAIIDGASLSLLKQYDISLDPFDIDVSGDIVFISSGSSQWTDFRSYSGTTGQLVSSWGIRQRSYIAMNSALQRIYTIDTDLSPRDYEAFDQNAGIFTSSHDSPYHGDYSMAENFRVSPDGSYVVNGSGLILSCTADRASDLRYVFMLNRTFSDVAFDLGHNLFYTATSGKKIYSYDYSTFGEKGTASTIGDVSALYYRNSKLIALSKLNTTQYMIETIDASAVAAPVVPVTGVTLNMTAAAIQVRHTLQLVATAAPSNATNKSISWALASQSSDGVIAVSTSGLITALKPGTAVVRAISASDPMKFADCSITVYSTFPTPVYDQDFWAVRPSMNSSRADAGAVELDGKIYVMGGNSVNNWTSNKMEIFDPELGTWIYGPDMPTPKYGLRCVVLGGKIYAIGGTNSLNAVNTVDMYDPSTNTWVPKAGMKNARCQFAVGVINNKIVVVGGRLSIFTAVNTIEEYDPVLDNWVIKGNLPEEYTDYNNMAYAVSGGELYLFGGARNQAETYEMSKVVMSYNPANGNWTRRSDMPTGKYSHTAAIVNGLIYVLGGYCDSALKVVEEYNPLTDRWSTKSDMPTGKGVPCAVTIAGRILLIGGAIAVPGIEANSISYVPTQEVLEYVPKQNNAVPVTGVTLNKTVLTLITGQGEQLSCTVLPQNATNKMVTWSIQSQSPADCISLTSYGAISALKVGSAVIRATSNANASKFADCSVGITAPVAPPPPPPPPPPPGGGSSLPPPAATGGDVTEQVPVLTPSATTIKLPNEKIPSAPAVMDKVLSLASSQLNAGVLVTKINAIGLDKAFENASQDANGVKPVVIEVKAVKGAKSYLIQFPSKVFTSKDKTRKIKVITPIATLTLPCNMFEGNSLSGIKIVGISLASVDSTGLDKSIKDVIGNKPILDINASFDGKNVEWNNINTPVLIEVAYTPTTEELNAIECLVVWNIDGNGKATSIPNGRYNKNSGAIVYNVKHFSKYAIAFNKVTFKDISNSRSKKAIEVMASKGIIKGASESNFNPRKSITRADFVEMLVSTLDLKARVDTNFNDVSSKASYYEAVGIAKKLGIVADSGNNKFLPNSTISRQEMLSIAAKALKFSGKKFGTPDTAKLAVYTDSKSIAEFAKSGIALLLQEGLLPKDKLLNPLKNATREEVAEILYNIYNLLAAD